MKFTWHPFAFAIVLLAAGRGLAQSDASPEFQLLFNGRDLSGWYGLNPHALKGTEAQRATTRAEQAAMTKEHWHVIDGAVVNDGHGPYLTTKSQFGDIELLIDYRTVAGADSGVYLRGTPQVQIWDFTDENKFALGADKGSGGLWNNSPEAPGRFPTVLADKSLGEWNSFRILQIGARTSVWLNDHHIVRHAIMENYWDRKGPLPRHGPIHLQTHGGEIRWRNIRVREIGEDEANGVLAEQNAEGFQPIFNARDLTGWKGAVDSYEVREGAIVCSPGRGGTLYTSREYSDFAVRLEFRLPAGGNNGLAIRYSGQGNPAYDGMCELQVLDSEHPKYAELDHRQYHGSAYGMVSAHRGYLRPSGEWNFQEVTVSGSHVTVELNGSVILEADLGSVTEYLGDRPHPGKGRTSGHFGFAGHGDPVEFRKISIRQL